MNNLKIVNNIINNNKCKKFTKDWTHYIFLVSPNNKTPKIKYNFPPNYIVMFVTIDFNQKLPILKRKFPSTLTVQFLDE